MIFFNIGGCNGPKSDQFCPIKFLYEIQNIWKWKEQNTDRSKTDFKKAVNTKLDCCEIFQYMIHFLIWKLLMKL